MNASGSASHVYVDVGSNQGIRNGMAVITAAGIVGKITSVYASASLMLLANDPSFAAGVISQKNRTQGTVRGTGDAAMVDFIANEQKLALDELFYTTGSDFLFPRGLKVGAVLSVKDGLRRKEVGLRLSGLEGGLEHVLIVVEGVHAPVPDAPAPPAEVTLLAPPADASIPLATAAQTGPPLTEADRVVEQHGGTVKNALPPTEIVKP
jgi:rod shape-determining protein MreC